MVRYDPGMARGFLLILILSALCASSAAASDYPPPDYTERSDRSARDFVEWVRLLGHDAWAVASAPARMGRNDWIAVGATAAIFAVLYNNDEEIHRWAVRNNDSGVLGAITDIGDKIEVFGLMGETGRWYALGMVTGYTFRWEKLERVTTDILFSHLVGGLISEATQQVFDRSRPHENQGAYNYGDGGTSLPSGHSTTIFELATVLAHHFPQWWSQTAFYGLASTVVVQRFSGDQHWASDAFLGAALGYGVARVIVKTNDRRGYLVGPVFEASTGRIGVALQGNF